MREVRRRAGLQIALTVVGLWAGFCPAALGGAAELSLDRAGVRDLLAAVLAEPIEIRGAAGARWTLAIRPPRRVDFADGGIEARLQVELPGIRQAVPFDVRYRPAELDAEGHLGFVAERAEPVGAWGSLPDLAKLLPAVALPRRLGGDLALGSAGGVGWTSFVQGVRVEPERLVLLLGLQIGRR